MMPSAAGLRQMFPRHTNNILFFITSSFGCKGNEKEQDVQKKSAGVYPLNCSSIAERHPYSHYRKTNSYANNDYNEPNKRLKMEK
jgi:hypothetical protein